MQDETTTSGEAAQHLAVCSSSCASPKYLSSRLCQVQEAAGCSEEQHHPAPATSPFHTCSSRASCGQNALLGGRCIFLFVPI